MKVNQNGQENAHLRQLTKGKQGLEVVVNFFFLFCWIHLISLFKKVKKKPQMSQFNTFDRMSLDTLKV